jgi:hypothetical protein
MTHSQLTIKSTAAVVLLVGICNAADVQTITARVVGVHDGDTLTALTDDKRQLKGAARRHRRAGTGPAVRAGFEAGVVRSGV